MQFLCDNDALLKLAQCNLVSELIDCFGAESKLVTLPQFRPWLSRHISKGRCDPDVGELLNGFDLTKVELPLSQLSVASRLSSPGIDEGEAVLFASACCTNSVVVFTGDKRAIKALSQQAQIDDVRDQLAGKILCIEQAILIIIERVSFDVVSDGVQAALAKELFQFDTALRVAFGSGEHTTKINAISTLQAYVDDLRSIAGNLLYVHN